MVILRSKVAVVGDATVGKSALTQTFHSNHYPTHYVMTIGVDFCVKIVNIPESQVAVELYIFDTAGQAIFKESVAKYWDNLSYAMLVYDVSNADSFKNLPTWLSAVRKVRPDLPGVLVANKVDLEDRTVVSVAQGEEFARANNLAFFKTSAMQRLDVDTPFNFIADSFYRSYEGAADKFSKLR
mmetsp:Transcript_25012/g.41194  ORF Transcript_25012/g.41194 Transcript_25012/m.41194 type:complete len:183 (-) Transcript_25012:154-702(-)|eukprot:CAMPEP_0184654050 /NCGR_PEP_ID=MMETSP0308-20130426/11751_1 /TAXON_ID=38269 /ORGANISM="Gloeochaete witrockiana, Strain SAG 46.84" /LENGTH=182 /DNA_ID=CAMNT_0027089847 /DNA_START=129 /DNA_END=677 /DNA_ORIENTATION=+